MLTDHDLGFRLGLQGGHFFDICPEELAVVVSLHEGKQILPIALLVLPDDQSLSFKSGGNLHQEFVHVSEPSFHIVIPVPFRSTVLAK